VAKVVPRDHIFINTNERYLDLVKAQLPEISEDNIMAEPIHRNTAPSVAWACHRLHHINPDALLLVTPSDQAVQNEQAFFQNIDEGFDFVQNNNCLLTLGVKPTRPEPGYGYIQLGDPAAHDVFTVKAFTEKPEREFAKMFVESGEFYWNTGIFLSNIEFLWNSFTQLLPMVLRRLDNSNPTWNIQEENDFVRENFPSYPNLSVDYGILEKSVNVYVMKGDFGWADLGTWHSIYEAMRKREDDNVIIDSDVMIDDAHNNVIKLPKGKLAVINGLDGYIVAEKDNVLLICKKEDSSSLVRKYVNEVLMQKGEGYI
jgi:mannose-1-phosphate guanylyltransferase